MIRGLPYDAEIEYLESTGTEYIDTGIVSSGFGIRADVVCAQTQSGGEMAIVGRSRGDGFELYSNYAAGKFGLWNRSGNYIELTRQLELSRVYSISAEITTTPTMTLSIDGNVTTKSITSATIADGNILVFKHTSYYFKGCIYSCKIYVNGVLVRDYIPVRVGSGSSAVGYMYDRVSKRLFGNAGSGAFVLGPDKAVPILSLHRYASPSNGVALGKMGCTDMFHRITAKDYVQNGLVAMWDGIENAGWGVHDASATTWKDLSGNNNDLVLQNGAHFDDNSLVTASRNSVSALLGLKLPYASIEACGFWDQSRNPSALVCFGNSSDDGIMLTASPAAIQTYNGSHQIIFNEAVSPYNTWAGVHDGSQHIPYVAGVVAMGTYSTNNWSRRDGNFGLSGSSNYAIYNFVGNYYCVRLYSRALTAAEIAANYRVDKARFNLP